MNHFRLSYVLCAFILLVRPSNSQESTVNCYSCSSYGQDGAAGEDYNDNCWDNLDEVDTIACPSSSGCATVQYGGTLSIPGSSSISTYIERKCNDYNISNSECITGTEFNTWYHERLDTGAVDDPTRDPTGWVFEGSVCACTGDKCNNDVSESVVMCYSCTFYTPEEDIPINEQCWYNFDDVDTITCPSSVGCATVIYNATKVAEGQSATGISRDCNLGFYNISLGECITGAEFNPWYHEARYKLGIRDDSWVYDGSGCACTGDRCNQEKFSGDSGGFYVQPTVFLVVFGLFFCFCLYMQEN